MGLKRSLGSGVSCHPRATLLWRNCKRRSVQVCGYWLCAMFLFLTCCCLKPVASTTVPSQWQLSRRTCMTATKETGWGHMRSHELLTRNSRVCRESMREAASNVGFVTRNDLAPTSLQCREESEGSPHFFLGEGSEIAATASSIIRLCLFVYCESDTRPITRSVVLAKIFWGVTCTFRSEGH